MPLLTYSENKARAAVEGGTILIDLGPVEPYLTSHIHASVSVLYEQGPGFGGRARDILPLDGHLLLIRAADGGPSLDHAAAMLRGKGLDVIGCVEQGGSWPMTRARTASLDDVLGTMPLLDVRDPGTMAPEGTPVMPVERLWARAGDLDKNAPLGVLAGFGVRAASALGILELLGFEKLTFVRTLAEGSVPNTASQHESTIFRAGGVG